MKTKTLQYSNQTQKTSRLYLTKNGLLSDSSPKPFDFRAKTAQITGRQKPVNCLFVYELASIRVNYTKPHSACIFELFNLVNTTMKCAEINDTAMVADCIIHKIPPILKNHAILTHLKNPHTKYVSFSQV